MNTKTHIPFFSWIVRKLTGRWARRTYLAIILIVLCLTITARMRSYIMARRIQAVLHLLAEIRIDQTSEEQLLKTVPNLTRSEDWKAGGIVQHCYYTQISNESDRIVPRFIAYSPEWLGSFAYWLGYRYMSFDASALVQDGKVSRVSYGLAREWGRPLAASYIVSVESAHGFWLPYRQSLEVTSQDDESPQYRPTGDEKRLHVTFTSDAPPELAMRAFQLDLSCFWGLHGCEDAREIAPGLWQDAQTIRASTYKRLITEKCPDSIIEGRMRYLPDVSVLLLEVTSSGHVKVNEEGGATENGLTEYQLKEVIREDTLWKKVGFRRMIPSPIDSTHEMSNQIWPPAKIGGQVLFFGNLHFDSCQIIPATPSALAIVRKAPAPPKRPEDEILKWLL